MLHAPDIGLLDNYGPGISLLFETMTWFDPKFLRHVIEQSPSASVLSDVDFSYQRKAADALEGPTVKGGNLQRSIDLCSGHPFETVAGITMSWSKIQAIRIGTGPIACPNEL